MLLPDGRQQWREDAIEELLAIQDADVLFVAGCEGNRVRFRPQFDVIILLGAPAGSSSSGWPHAMAIFTARQPVSWPVSWRPAGRRAAAAQDRWS